MSLRRSLTYINRDDDDNKTFVVDLTGQSQPEANGRFKIVDLDATHVQAEMDDKLEECLFSSGNILLRIANFPDQWSSAVLADEVIEFTYRAFRRMKDSFKIIVNCMHGRNRSPAIASRLAYRIASGENQSCEEVYQMFQHICSSMNPDFSPHNRDSWPRVCMNHLAQEVIHLFPRGTHRYASSCFGVSVEDPLGEVECSYRYAPGLLEEEINYLRHHNAWIPSTRALIDARLNECIASGDLRHPDQVVYLLNQLRPRSVDVSEDFRALLHLLDNTYLFSIACSFGDIEKVCSYFRVDDGYPKVQIVGLDFESTPLVVRREDAVNEWEDGWLALNELRSLTRLDSQRDVFAFNAFCWFVTNPNTHWSHESNIGRLDGLYFTVGNDLTIDA